MCCGILLTIYLFIAALKNSVTKSPHSDIEYSVLPLSQTPGVAFPFLQPLHYPPFFYQQLICIENNLENITMITENINDVKCKLEFDIHKI
jgi:hypothetical protein